MTDENPEAPKKGRLFSRFPGCAGTLVTVAVTVVIMFLLWMAPLTIAAELFLVYLVLVLMALSFPVRALFSKRSQRFRFLAGWVPLMLVAVLALTVRQIELVGAGVPQPVFRWSPRVESLDHYRERQDPPTASVPAVVRAGPWDFPEFRGRGRNGVVVGPPIHRDWQAHPPELVWRHPVGGGFSGIVVAGSLAVTFEQRRDHEAVVAYDRATGKELWAYEYPAHFTLAAIGPGPRATPTFFDGHVFSLGAQGLLLCLEGTTGKKLWQRDILDDAAVENAEFGMTGSPLVFADLVVVNPGGTNGSAVIAYDRRNGEIVWQNGAHPAAYSSPMLVSLAGERQVLIFDADGLGAHDPHRGDELWRHPWPPMLDYNTNAIQPLVVGKNSVLISSYSGSGIIDLRRDAQGWQVTERWRRNTPRFIFNSPVYHAGYVYGLDNGILVCLDPKTGKRCWKKGRYGHGHVLLIDDLLLITGEKGELALVEAAADAYRELGRFQVFDYLKNWNTPALAEGRLFVRNQFEMACYDLKAPTE